MVRRVAVFAVALGLLVACGRGRADDPAVERGGVAGLAERLKTGLRIKAPHDVQFVETVAERVREGRLPELRLGPRLPRYRSRDLDALVVAA